MTARPPRPRPSYAVAPSVSLEDDGEGGAGRTPESCYNRTGGKKGAKGKPPPPPRLDVTDLFFEDRFGARPPK